MIKLPIDEHLENISHLIDKHQNLVIKASPGSGKTTRIPPFLNKRFKKILVLEPRRIAAISASDRIASENDWVLGDKVGYHVRFDKKYSDKTEIIFLTEALLARQLLNEDSLKGIDLIILDEFHERSLWTDLCLGIIKEWQELDLPLKLILLSATIDESKIQTFLSQCAVYNVDLPTYPLEKIYSKSPFKLTFDFGTLEKIVESLKDAVTRKRKNILIFLPGTGEIQKTYKELSGLSFLKNYEIETLHGNISLEEQKRIINNQSATNKIILSTNLAESSVTINNLDTVIDTGLIKVTDYQIKTAVQQLTLRKISLASAEQRQGRAHRQHPGLVYKLWTLHDELSMEKFTPPEITRSDLSLSLMFLTFLGANSHTYFKSFSWFEAPSDLNLKLTTEELLEKKIIQDNHLTPLGKLLLHLNIEYHLGILILLGDNMECLKEACDMVALIQEKDIFSDTSYRSSSAPNSQFLFSDLLLRFENYTTQSYKFPQVTKLSQSLHQSFKNIKLKQQLDTLNMIPFDEDNILKLFNETKKKNLEEKLRFIIDFTFIDRICRRRKKDGKTDFYINEAINRYSSETSLYEPHFQEYFYPQHEYYLSLKNFFTPSKNLVSSWIHFIDPERLLLLLSPYLKAEFQFQLNEDTQRVSKSKVICYHEMVLRSIEGLEVSSADRSHMFQSLIKAKFEEYKNKIPDLNLFFRRIDFLKQQTLLDPNYSFNPSELIEQVCYQETSLESILNKNWQATLDNILEPTTKDLLNKEAPLFWKDKKTQKQFKIYYDNREAFLESKLQSFFGLKEHPCIGSQRYALKLVMLGPNGRPIQITRDLISFWSSSYPEIRKELRGRYPKHAWPEYPESY